MTKSARIAVLIVFGAALLGAGAFSYGRTFDRLRAGMQEAGHAQLALHGEYLRGWLGRYRALPSIYAHQPEIIDLLRDPGDPARVAAINEKLEYWNIASGASDTYLLDRNGIAVAASNWSGELSFVGSDYGFRPYFQQAMQGRLGRYFAMGTRSGKRGYYFAYPVQDGGPIIGAVVVKAATDPVEQDLRLSLNGVFVTDPNGIVVLAGPPHWRMKTVAPLDPDTLHRIMRERQFPAESLQPLPVEGLAEIGAGVQGTLVQARPDRSDSEETAFVHLSRRMTIEDWTAHILLETRGIRAQSLGVALLVSLCLLTLGLMAWLLWQRRRRMLMLLAEREQARSELEALVSERTADLRLEVSERTQAEADLRRAQSELVQAGKLAALGQMSAGLSHEFNQPLAAIRTYADNAGAFIERGRADSAIENLARISRLTERMAQLSKHLTSFARKPKDTVGEVSLDATIHETLELLRGRIERSEARIENTIPPGITIMGGQTRLQHVFMNLIGNALDATSGLEGPVIALGARVGEGGVTVWVEDNGPGIPQEALAQIFDPFFSLKEPGKGLGLGLSISFNIVHDFGGVLSAENRAGGGARFTVSLRAADRARDAAE